MVARLGSPQEAGASDETSVTGFESRENRWSSVITSFVIAVALFCFYPGGARIREVPQYQSRRTAASAYFPPMTGAQDAGRVAHGLPPGSGGEAGRRERKSGDEEMMLFLATSLEFRAILTPDWSRGRIGRRAWHLTRHGLPRRRGGDPKRGEMTFSVTKTFSRRSWDCLAARADSRR